MTYARGLFKNEMQFLELFSIFIKSTILAQKGGIIKRRKKAD
jgi:hypothetical protein